jgi:hypothetical protein
MNLPDINIALSLFATTGLNEMDEVKLMNRCETKYVFSSEKISGILSLLVAKYRVLEIDKVRSFRYHTTYLDTTDLLFYMQQVRGKLDRFKIRYRLYESTRKSFLEIKKKTNKNRTIKWRIETSSNTNSSDESANSFIKEYSPCRLTDLQPALINGFSRITLVGKEFRERITIDYDLSFTSPEGKNLAFPFLAIAEIKREKNNSYSPFGIIMRQIGIHPNNFSKYCIGSVLVRDMPRQNLLKRNILQIKKIENEYIKSTGS